jgi:hypothetical protein
MGRMRATGILAVLASFGAIGSLDAEAASVSSLPPSPFLESD